MLDDAFGSCVPDDLTLPRAAARAGVYEATLREAYIAGDLPLHVAVTPAGVRFVCSCGDLERWSSRRRSRAAPSAR